MARFDQQLVRRDGNSWKRQGGLSLCEVCGLQEACSLPSAMRVMGSTKRANIVVQGCGEYVPVLGFQDRTGLYGFFNTFRRGMGWARRVTEGGQVGLYDMTADVLLGYAVVSSVHIAPLGTLLTAHASANHLMRHLPEREAPELLHKILVRLYGKTYAALDQEFSVVYLKEVA